MEWSDARFDAENGMASDDWGGSVAAKGSSILKTLLGGSSMANPLSLMSGALGAAAGSSATSSSNGNRFESNFGNTGWNVNFGEGSITSSAANGTARESISQWIGIAAGVVTILVALKMLKG
jgi:hypothetical protein